MHAENPRFGDTKGQTLPLIVVFMLLLMVVCGMVLDIGNAYRVKTGLQASADAAAAAGADSSPTPATPTPLCSIRLRERRQEPGARRRQRHHLERRQLRHLHRSSAIRPTPCR